jgi:uncharacterized membrane protein
MGIGRWFGHLTTTHLALWRRFPAPTRARIDARIAAGERTHGAEIRCAIETHLSLRHLWRGVTARERAGEVFALLGMRDTAAGNGILLYVLLAERDIEIVADAGFEGRVAPATWEAICKALEAAFRAREFESGTLAALDSLAEIAAHHFPHTGSDRNELPDHTVIL